MGDGAESRDGYCEGAAKECTGVLGMQRSAQVCTGALGVLGVQMK